MLFWKTSTIKLVVEEKIIMLLLKPVEIRKIVRPFWPLVSLLQAVLLIRIRPMWLSLNWRATLLKLRAMLRIYNLPLEITINQILLQDNYISAENFSILSKVKSMNWRVVSPVQVTSPQVLLQKLLTVLN